MDKIEVTALRWVPPFVQGHVRDLRVRWALAEAGHGYVQRLIGQAEQASPAYRALQPFGQVPAYAEDGLALFESGAIVLHIAEASIALMPADAAGRARVRTWMFAALNTIEPPAAMLAVIDMQPGGAQPGELPLRQRVLQLIDRRLAALDAALGAQQHLCSDRFTAADLLMATVLRDIDPADRGTPRPRLDAYLARCTARPAFGRALAEQLADFAANAPPGAS